MVDIIVHAVGRVVERISSAGFGDDWQGQPRRHRQPRRRGCDRVRLHCDCGTVVRQHLEKITPPVDLCGRCAGPPS